MSKATVTVNGMTFTFRRGFVEEVTCAAADWLAHGDVILKCCPIRHAKHGLVRLYTRYRDIVPLYDPSAQAMRVLKFPGVRFELFGY